MENQVGSDSLISAGKPTLIKGWIVHPAFDLLLFANLYWPLFLLPGFSGNQGTVFDFWQIYYLTLPHRWITLFLVGFDPDRREGIGNWILAACLVPAFVIGGLYGIFGDFRCLALVDFLWNAWHFGSQHAGILRIYDRISERAASPFQRWGIRWFVFYVLLRTVEWSFDWIETDSLLRRIIEGCDVGTLAIGLALVAANLVPGRPQSLAKLAYLASILALYGGLLGALMTQQHRLALTLATAAAMFHAVEYLSIVSHYAARRSGIGSPGLFREISRRWLVVLPSFVIGLAGMGIWLDVPSGPAHTFWIGLNLWMALVHYSVDGMIWKLRKPRTAQALGLGTGLGRGP